MALDSIIDKSVGQFGFFKMEATVEIPDVTIDNYERNLNGAGLPRYTNCEGKDAELTIKVTVFRNRCGFPQAAAKIVEALDAAGFGNGGIEVNR